MQLTAHVIISSCRCRCSTHGRIRHGLVPSLERKGSVRAVEDRENLRLEFVQNPAVVLRLRCSARSGPLPVSKRYQRHAIVFADLRELRVANAPATYFQLAQREPSSRWQRYLTPSLPRTICFAPSAGSLKRRNDCAEICTAEGSEHVRNMYEREQNEYVPPLGDGVPEAYRQRDRTRTSHKCHRLWAIETRALRLSSATAA